MNYVILAFLWSFTMSIAFLLGDYFGTKRRVVAPTAFGRFVANPKVELLEDRSLKLLDDFIYIDPHDEPWLAAKGRIVDGASIPRLFWSVMGGPLSGKYRNASIVHDVECDDRRRPYEKVHLMFYHACLAGGVPDGEAKKLYWAVARFGPRWAYEHVTRSTMAAGPESHQERVDVSEAVAVALPAPTPTEDDLTWANEYFGKHSPPVEQIPLLDRGEDEAG